MTFILRTVLLTLLLVILPARLANAQAPCVNLQTMTEKIKSTASLKGHDAPRFRIRRNQAGQALIYWDYGEATKKFYAVTFSSDGCIVKMSNGMARRFVFPKTRFNAGVFYELEKLAG